MREKDNSRELQKKIATLENELAEAKETLRAIHAGEIDALVIATPKGDQIFTLKGAEYSYRVMVETMGEGAVTLDDIGTILYCNKRFADVIETPLENVIGTPIYPFIRAGDLACFKDLLEPVALGKQMETTLLSRKGREVPVLLSVNSLNLEEAPAVACLIVSDLTEQKRNEKIIASERLAKSIFEQTTEAFVICGPDGSVIRASQAAQRLADDSLLLKAFDATFRLGYAGQEKRSFTIQDILRGNTFRETEFVLEKRHGDARFILLSAGPLKDEEEVIGCVVLMIDITERRRAEAELRQRTASLEAMNADLESFSYSISHDLRAPLRAIDGFSTMIVRQYGDEMEGELKRKFDIIRQNAERMDKLIGDILNLSRLGRKAVASESLDMKELFQEAWYQLSQTALARNVSFKVTEMARTERGPRSHHAGRHEPPFERPQVHARPQSRPDRGGMLHPKRLECLLRERQRDRLRHEIQKQALRRLPAPPQRRRVRGYRGGPGHREENHSKTQRDGLGRRGIRERCYFLLFPAGRDVIDNPYAPGDQGKNLLIGTCAMAIDISKTGISREQKPWPGCESWPAASAKRKRVCTPSGAAGSMRWSLKPQRGSRSSLSPAPSALTES